MLLFLWCIRSIPLKRYFKLFFTLYRRTKNQGLKSVMIFKSSYSIVVICWNTSGRCSTGKDFAVWLWKESFQGLGFVECSNVNISMLSQNQSEQFGLYYQNSISNENKLTTFSAFKNKQNRKRDRNILCLALFSTKHLLNLLGIRNGALASKIINRPGPFHSHIQFICPL